MNPPLLTPEEAAAYLQISVEAFLAWRRRRGIPNRNNGRRVRVFQSDLIKRPPTVVDFEYAARALAQKAEARHA